MILQLKIKRCKSESLQANNTSKIRGSESGIPESRDK